MGELSLYGMLVGGVKREHWRRGRVVMRAHSSLPCLAAGGILPSASSAMWVAVSFALEALTEWTRSSDTGWLKALGVPPMPAH